MLFANTQQCLHVHSDSDNKIEKNNQTLAAATKVQKITTTKMSDRIQNKNWVKIFTSLRL